jgi:hypothetical protein
VIAEPDRHRRYVKFAAFATKTNARIYALHQALRGQPRSTRRPGAVWALGRRTLANLSRRTGRTAGQTKALKPGLSPSEAADILYLLLSPPTYHRLVVERGWTPARYRKWLAATLAQQTLAPRLHL